MSNKSNLKGAKGLEQKLAVLRTNEEAAEIAGQKLADKPDVEQIWVETGSQYFRREIGRHFKQLDNAVYTVEITQMGEFYLERQEERFDFPYKVYGLESKLIQRTLKTYKATTGNMGLLLNGIKGTGKTVTSKILANELNMPVILISKYIPGAHFFLNTIEQDVTIFIDEYEKVYEEDSEMLAIMDGALNSEHRRVFLLTTNKLYVNENLLQRPSRIRYLKTFQDLTPEITEEIVNDCLIHKQFKADIMKFIANLEIITVDIVKAVVSEVNIHEEAPLNFKDVFNVKKITGKYDVSIVDLTGVAIPFKKNVTINPRNFDEPDQYLGYNFMVGNEHLGRITEILDAHTIKVQPTKKKSKEITVKFERADSIHKNYAYAF